MITLENFDINFDFTEDTPDYWEDFWEDEILGGGKDPDSGSPMLKLYHQFLWTQPLPNGEIMKLETGHKGYYLRWKDVSYGSDSIISSFRYDKRRDFMKHLSSILPDYKGFVERYLHKANTIGGFIIFPQISGSINQSRGFNARIRDRWDLTLECIRRFYNNEESPLTECLERNREFFELFVDFKGYVDYFYLQDCVTEDYSKVKLWYDSPLFEPNQLPDTVEDYLSYIKQELDFVEKRNERIMSVYRPAIPQFQIEFKDIKVELRSLNIEGTFDGCLEGDGASNSFYKLRRETRNVKKGYTFLKPKMVNGRSGEELPPYHYLLSFREMIDGDFYELKVSFYDNEPSDRESLQSFINRHTRKIKFKESAERYDIDDYFDNL